MTSSSFDAPFHILISYFKGILNIRISIFTLKSLIWDDENDAGTPPLSMSDENGLTDHEGQSGAFLNNIDGFPFHCSTFHD